MASHAAAPQYPRSTTSHSTNSNPYPYTQPTSAPQLISYQQQPYTQYAPFNQQPLSAASSFSSTSSSSQPRQSRRAAAQVPGYCKHSFKIIDSETTDLLWECEDCASGPHWFIFQCKQCQLKVCRVCCYHA